MKTAGTSNLPRLYAIVDAETCDRRGFDVMQVAEAWRDAGVRLLQYRDKKGSDTEVLRTALLLRDLFAGTGATLILNDRVNIFSQTGFDGVHVGQTDLRIEETRAIIGADALLGISTHNVAQMDRAGVQDVTYVAVGPVFATGTKLDADPVIGVEGVRGARRIVARPLVAIGGITRANAAEIIAAGADSVAVISGLLPPPGSTVSALMETARDFLAAFK